ncbi:MAG: hypothetical protein ACKOQL_06005, partial [Actinomycetes bacterium]
MRDSTRLRTVLAVLLLLSFTFVALELRTSGSGLTKSLREFTANVISPIQESSSNFSNTWNEIRTARSQVKDLQSENLLLKEELAKSEENRRRAAELDALLKLA